LKASSRSAPMRLMRPAIGIVGQDEIPQPRLNSTFVSLCILDSFLHASDEIDSYIIGPFIIDEPGFIAERG